MFGRSWGTTRREYSARSLSNLVSLWEGHSGRWQESGRSTAVTANGAAVGAWDDVIGSHHLTQSTDNNRPTIKTQEVNGYPAIEFNGSSQFLATGSYSLSQPFTVALCYKPVTLGVSGTNDIVYSGLSGDDYLWAASHVADVSTPFTHPYAGTVTTTAYHRWVDKNYQIVIVQFNGASTKIWRNGVLVETGSFGTQAFAGLTLGKLGSGNRHTNIRVLELAVFSSLSDNDRDTLTVGWAEKYGIARVRGTPKQAVFDGDSLTQGYSGVATQSTDFQRAFPGTVLASLGSPWFGRSFGVGGQTVLQMSSDAATQIDGYKSNSWAKNVLVLLGGTNDIYFGADASTTASRITTYVTDRTNAGWTVIPCSLIARNDNPSYQAVIDAVNTSLRATYGAALCDLAAVAALSDPTNLTYYTSDGVHLTAAGYNVVAATVLPYVRAA